jgi:hypothetical protein
MALMDCRECKQSVSTTAKACPHCGAKVKKPANVVGGIMGGLLVGGLLIGMVSSHSGSKGAASAQPPSAAQLAAGEKTKTDDAEDLYRVCALRQAMKNPDAFKLVSAVRAASGELCVEYRATNSFNAIITEHVKFSPVDKNQSPVPVPACSGPGKDVTTALKYNLPLC